MKQPYVTNLALAVILFFVSISAFSQQEDVIYSFRLKNVCGFDRVGELVEIDVPAGTNLNAVALLDESGSKVAFEPTADGAIRFLASVGALSTTGYKLVAGKPDAPETMTYSQVKMPANRADIAWENNLCAYRMYSTTLLGSEPNTAQGVDVWQKKTEGLVVDNMYALSNYHAESQYGMDVYSVNGKRLGCGGTAAVVDGHLAMHAPYNKCEFIEQSALKQVFRLTYDNVVIGGNSYTKTLVVETSANSMLNKATMKLEGKAGNVSIAIGIYDHSDMGIALDGNNFTDTQGVVGRAELKSEGSVTTAGARFYQGAYVPGSDVVTKEIDSHLCLVVDYTVGTELTFYFGAGWNHFPKGRYGSDAEWFDALERFKMQTEHPLTLTSFNTLPTKDDVLYILNSVNQTWQTRYPNHGDFFWNRAVYYIGNMHAYEVTHNQDYLDFATAWAERNRWRGRDGDSDPTKWKWTYGESYNYVLFGDNQVCFQVYADLYNLDPDKDPVKIARALEVMGYEISTDEEGYLWWVDGLFMVMPVMSKLYNITGNQLYLDKMYTYWKWYTDRMFDNEENLYYRDASYVYPSHKTLAGKKDFWARGDGWIFAAFAKILQDLPADDAHRDEYIDYYRRMAAALKRCQQPDGYWERSLIDPDQAPGYETSGTAFYAYGYAWGINNGILSEVEYGETLERAWNYLANTAYQADGTVGYIQPIGSAAIPGQHLYATSYYDFGVGAFLMAAAEISKLAVGDMQKTKLRLTDARLGETDEIVLTFNTQPDPAVAANAEHYTLNGVTPDIASIDCDDRTVTLQLNEPIDYGCYRLEVNGLQSIEGGELADGQGKNIILPVPLSPAGRGLTITAIGAQSGNPAANINDNNLSTRWSQEGRGQWIQIDLGSVNTVEAVDIAFYNGNQRIAFFDIQTSKDGKTFENTLTDVQSSGLTTQLERFKIAPAVEARYVRVVGNGTTESQWNSITEMRVRVKDESARNIQIPTTIHSDILLPQTTDNGNTIVWTSSDKSVMSGQGLVTLSDADQHVTLTANVGAYKKTFDVVVKARNPLDNLQLLYSFDDADVYRQGGRTYVRDHSRYGRDAELMGTNGNIGGGILNLAGNKAQDFQNNSYMHLPNHLLDSLRSYTVAFVARPSSLNKQPRFYDFGAATANSIFLRANRFAAGYKYNGGTTVLAEAAEQLTTGRELKIAVTFNATTKVTKVYVNGKCMIENTNIVREPYEITQLALDNRNYIGRTQWWDSNAAADNYDYQGTIDDFHLFSMELTETEISQVFDHSITSVEPIGHDLNGSHDDKVFDIAGRQVKPQNLQKGIYIRNGQIVLIK